MTRLLDSPHVGLDAGPDVRRGILTRRTFRTFERRPVEASERRSVLEAGRWAWSAPGAEPVRFIVLDDPALKRALHHLTRESKDISNHWEGLFRPAGLRGYIQHWNATPFCIAVCADSRGGPRHIHDGWNAHIASAAACQNLALAARGQGMALVMYTHFSQEKLKRLLDAPFEWDVAGVMGVGYPDLKRTNPQVLARSLERLPLHELVSAERYGAPAPEELIAERGPAAPVADLLETVRGLRFATRFRAEPVAPGAVFEVLRAGQWAPSAGNFQPVRYVVLRDRERLAALAVLARESVEISAHWFPRYREGTGEHPDWSRVPLAVALIADPSRGGPHIHGEATHVHAGGLAYQNMALMAQALGLGTNLVTHWIEEKVKVLLDCPRAWDLVGVVPLGVPAEAPARAPRPLATLVFRDGFGRAWPAGAESRESDAC
ncbi:MAG: nitroreductase family protein [Candidatus Rokuibacteriota bacterium]